MELKQGEDFAQLPLRVLAPELLVYKIKLKLVLLQYSQVLQFMGVIYRIKQLPDATATSTDLIIKKMSLSLIRAPPNFGE